jgi:DNA-binding CsgD family transcriptional regulator/tetratricopeptide (TPR) repeat protein
VAPEASGEIVGREAELETARAFIDSVFDGPAAFFIEGEAGIGKTSVWSRCLHDARARGVQLLVSRAAQAETGLGFTTLVDLLAGVGNDVLDELPRPQRRALEIALLRAETAKGRADPRAVSTATLGVLRSLARTTPLLLAIDDLQWVDSASERVLRFVLRRLEDERIGFVATRRVESDDSATAFDRTLAASRVHRLRLEPLSLDEIEAVVLGLGDRLARPTLQRLYTISGGNPFFALEIGRALQRRDSSGPARLVVPDSLHALVRDRLDALGPATQRALFAASALSRPTVDQVMQALGGARGGLRALERAADAQVVELDAGSIAFTHPLLASAVYASRSPPQRRRLHRALSAVVTDPEERGRHLALATVRPSAEIAAVVERAGDHARRRGAPDAAAELYEQAKRLTPAADATRRYRRTVQLADARLQAGDVRSARLAFAEASEAAPDPGAGAFALTRLGELLVLDWESNLSNALETYERASRAAAGDPTLVAAIEVDLAWLWHFRDDQTRSCVHARRALELAREIDDGARIAHALATCALFEGRRGNDEAWALLEAATRFEECVRDEPFAGRPQFVRAFFLLGDGLFEQARAISLNEYGNALERGDESSLPTLLEHLAIVERRAGRWDEAEQYAREMYWAAERGGFMAVHYSASYALILALRGRVEEARLLVEEHVAIADAAGVGPIFGGHRAVLGFIALSLGDATACIEQLEPLSSMLTVEIAESGWVRFLVDEIEALLTVGDVERARGLVERLAERRSMLTDRAWACAATERCRGLVCAASGDEAGAGAAFAQALALHEQLPEPFELARTLLAQGRVERRFKRRRRARETLTRAREIFVQLGASLWAERTEEELSRIGGRSPRGAGLTSTEEKVARLTVTGLTNRQIAAELFISENTVETNLKRIYRELGVRSRTELAAKLLVPSDSKNPDSRDSAGRSAS